MNAQRFGVFFAAMAVVVLSGLMESASAAGKKVRISAEDLYIVDCLLPPQVRQLGQRFTYAAARRPIRTTAKDCAIRGGEYVAYDRSNYSTALKVWMPDAKRGDAKAQTYVGEIFEQGLGLEPNYEQAAQWYQKAAEQGYSRAVINLGSLYESGLGVDRDMTKAMNLYRTASGLEGGTLEFTTEADLAQRRAAAREAAELRSEVLALKAALDESEANLSDRRRDLARAQAELQRVQESTTGGGNEDVAAMRQQLQSAERDRVRLKTQLEQAELESEVAQLEMTRMQVELERSETVLSAAQAEIDGLRARLISADEQQSEELLEQISEREKALSAQRRQAQWQEQELQQKLKEAEAKLEASTAKQNSLQQSVSDRDSSLAAMQQRLASAEAEVMEMQRRLLSDADAQRVSELEAEIARKQAEIDEYEASQAALLAQLGAGNPSTDAEGSVERISIISPQVAVTRGTKKVTLFAPTPDYEIVGQVTPANGIITFRVNDQDLLSTLDSNGLFQVPIVVAPDRDTPVSIEAIHEDGTRSVADFTLSPPEKEVIATRSTSRTLRRRMKNDLGRFHAVVIGNNQHEELEPLSTAVSDAQSVADVLKSRYGFKVSLLENATKDEIVFELARVTEELKRNDNLLIYYAGHGVLDEQSGDGYWLPTDASRDNPASWIGNDQITDFLGAMEAKHVLVVADSCYSGTLSGRAIRPIPLQIEDEDLLFISRVRARTVLSSGGLQPVLDDGGSGHSIFGRAFIKALEENREIAEGYRIFDKVRAEVVSQSRLARLSQNPEYSALQHAGHEGSEFFFMPRDLKAALQPDPAQLLVAP